MQERIGTELPHTQQNGPHAEAFPSAARSFFFGQQGLRAGWSVVLFLVILALLEFAAFFLLRLLVHSASAAGTRGGEMPPLRMLVGEAVQLAALAGATWLMAAFERRPASAYGYAGPARLSRLCWGAIWGLAAISTLVLSLHLAGVLAFTGTGITALAALRYGLAWACGFLLVGLFEESLLRGYLQFTLARGIGFWWAALLLSALFGASHLGNSGESRTGIASAAAVGLVFSLSLRLTGSLWWAIGFHAAWDWGQSFLFGTADSGILVRGHLLASRPSGPVPLSGGATGPEGSLLIFPLLALIALAIFLWWRPRSAST